MTQQASMLLTGDMIAPLPPGERRSLFRVPDLNLKIVASGSMLLCSAMLLNSGAQLTKSEITSEPCDDSSCSTSSKAEQKATKASPAAISGQKTEQQQSEQRWSSNTQEWSTDRFIEQMKGNDRPDKLPQEVETNYAELVNQAQSAASRDQITDAVEAVAGIPKNSEHYDLAQQLEEDWSQELVRQATKQYQQADVSDSISLIDKIPETSKWHGRATELKQRWQEQSKLLHQAMAAKSSRDWQGTINAIKALDGAPLYNSLPVQELLQEAITKLYEPDQDLVQIAVADSPAMTTSDAPMPDFPEAALDAPDDKHTKEDTPTNPQIDKNVDSVTKDSVTKNVDSADTITANLQ
jgi:hypothetical protein